MFSSRSNRDSFSKHRAGKSSSQKVKRSFKDKQPSFQQPAHLDLSSSKHFAQAQVQASVLPATQTSAVITISVGHSPPRLFAAHENVLSASPFFLRALRSDYYNAHQKKLDLPDEVPEIFAAILEFMYKGDYFPKLEHDKRRNQWYLENAAASPGNPDSAVWIPPPSPGTLHRQAQQQPAIAAYYTTQAEGSGGAYILKDTAIYCTAEKYGLDKLKKLALRKQGFQAGVPVATILASARYAYAHTPENDSKLRAHYLALIIRSRNTFKRSGTMQQEMSTAPTSPILGDGGNTGEISRGTGLWFDLFVAMCNHLDDMESIVAKSPR